MIEILEHDQRSCGRILALSENGVADIPPEAGGREAECAQDVLRAVVDVAPSHTPTMVVYRGRVT